MTDQERKEELRKYQEREIRWCHVRIEQNQKKIQKYDNLIFFLKNEIFEERDNIRKIKDRMDK